MSNTKLKLLVHIIGGMGEHSIVFFSLPFLFKSEVKIKSLERKWQIHHKENSKFKKALKSVKNDSVGLINNNLLII